MDLKDGYYFLSSKQDPQKCLIYLYDHPDFNGMRHISYGRHDGGALMPVTDLIEDAILEPVAFVKSTEPATNNALNFKEPETLDAIISGVIYDFSAYLTSRKESITCGAEHEIPQIIEAIKDFMKKRGVDDSVHPNLGWGSRLARNIPVTNAAAHCHEAIINNADALSYFLESLCVILDGRNSDAIKNEIFNGLIDQDHLYERCLEIKELFKDVAGIRR